MRSYSLKFFFCLFLALTLGLGVLSTQVDAQTRGEWKKFASETGLFTLLMPKNADEKSVSFRVDDSRIIYSSEVTGFIDQRPYKDIIKSYIVTMDQTFGPALTNQNRTDLINRDLNIYESQYKAMGGVVKDRKFTDHAKEYAGEILMTYEDPELGLQGVRAIVAMSNSNRLRQIVTGDVGILTSHETQEFFDSTKMQKGIVYEEGSINEDWDRLESPFQLFAIKVPPVSPPYFANEAQVQSSSKRELVSLVFTDPIWGQQLFYNIYGYRFDGEIGFAQANTVMLQSHVEKHRGPRHGIKLNKSFYNKTPQLTAEYQVKGPKGYPYVNTVKLRGLFLGNYMIVQEVMGSEPMVLSGFTEGMFNLIEFTPKKAFKHYLTSSIKQGLSQAQ